MTHLLAVAKFEAPRAGSSFSVAGLGLLDGVSAEARERALWWQVHVVEVETGVGSASATDGTNR
ncbi:hypothetical protein [Pseudonocardia sp. HH130629-09]|uniref:hypothetical protein n=1 Tax=Pseudonocardia sp. HH130629-09 TaxID=1641402 RepID=UPI0011AE64CA|nr:hypothetical protein [Pseudonocardia sp. HH130629-09]